MESLIGMIVMLGGPVLYGWLQWRAIRAASGTASWLWALAPTGLIAVAAVFTGIGLAADQNLAPLILVFSFPIAVIWLAVGDTVRWMRG
jgi:plastocyanin